MAHPGHAINWNGPQPAPKALWKLIHANFPQAKNMGIYNPRNIAGTHTPSLHAEGRALDIGLSVLNPSQKLLGDQLFKALMDVAPQIGLQEVIWNRQIWSAARPHVHPDTGHNPHTDHVHVGFTRDGSQRTNLSALLIPIAQIRTGIEDLARGGTHAG